jgi:hypothetical protein
LRIVFQVNYCELWSHFLGTFPIWSDVFLEVWNFLFHLVSHFEDFFTRCYCELWSQIFFWGTSSQHFLFWLM